MTALTLYGTESASSLATACKLVTATGGVSASKTTKVGLSQGTGELFSLGSTATFPTGGSVGAAGVDGYLWDVTTLELNTIAAGTWTVKLNLAWNLSYTTATTTITARVWNRSSGGVYTKIGSDMTVAGPGAATTTQTLFTLTGSSFPSMDFNLGDKLYLDIWLTVASTGGASTRTIALWASSSATAGIAGQVEINTPGYAATPGITNLVLYGSSVADSTLTTANLMAATSGGAETSKVSTYSGTGNFGEVYSQAGSVAAVAAIPTTPTGHGWVYYPGAGSFALGNWEAALTMAVTANNVGNETLRLFRLSGGVYTSIGTITFVATATAKTTYSPASVSMAAITFASSDALYIDLWYQDSFGAASDTATIYEGTSSVAGVVADMQITTSAFSSSSGVALSATVAGVGTATVTLTATTALAVTDAGVGVLSPSLTATQPISATLTGVGVITIAAPTFATALSVAESGIGVLSPALSASYTLTGTTLVGVGVLTGTGTFNTALSSTLVGVGVLTGALSIPATGGVSDSFIRTTTAGSTAIANVAGWSTASDGNTWTADLGTGAPTWNINTNRGKIIGTAVPTYTQLSTTTFTDSDVSAVLAAAATNSASNMGVVARYSSTSSGYIAYIAPGLTPNGVFAIAKCNGAGAPTILASQTSLAFVATTRYAIRLQCSGTTIQARFWDASTAEPGTWNVTTTDASFSAGKTGFYFLPATTSAIFNVDTFAGNPLGVALGATFAGTGGCSATLLATESFTTTLTGTSTLAGTLTLTTALSGTAAGIGVLTPTLSANYSVTGTTLVGAATLAGAFTESTALTQSLIGGSTLTASMSSAVPLTNTLVGVGTFASAAFSVTTSLSSTFAAAGTLTANLTGGGSLSGTLAGVGTFVGVFTESTALSSTLSGIGVLTPTLTASFVLTGTSLVGNGTLTGVCTERTALASSLVGSGSLNGTMSAALSLASTALTGIGTLTGVLTGGGSLSVTCTGISTLVGAFTASTPLTTTFVGIGASSETVSLTTALGDTLVAVGTLTAVLGAKTALSTSYTGIGTLAGTITIPGSVALSCTYAGIGVLTASAPTFATALTTPIPASGILTGVLNATTALGSTLVGNSTLVSAWTLKTALTTTIIGAGALNSTIQAATTFSSVTLIGIGVLGGAAAYAVHLNQTLAGTTTLTSTFTATCYLSVLCMGMGACFPSPRFAGVVYTVEVYAVAMSSMITIQADDAMVTTVAMISSPQES